MRYLAIFVTAAAISGFGLRVVSADELTWGSMVVHSGTRVYALDGPGLDGRLL